MDFFITEKTEKEKQLFLKYENNSFKLFLKIYYIQLIIKKQKIKMNKKSKIIYLIILKWNFL